MLAHVISIEIQVKDTLHISIMAGVQRNLRNTEV